MRGGRRRGRWYGAGAVVAVALLATGVAVAVRGYLATSGPAGAVRGYFAALASGDAASALAYGDVPSGSRTLLTDRALAAARHNGAIKRVRVGHVDRHGAQAQVDVHYVLDFPGAPQPVDAVVPVHEAGGDWRLDAVAVDTALTMDRAVRRATVLGTRLTSAAVLLFPGAVPVRLDTGLLALDPASASVALGGATSTAVGVVVSDDGRARARAQVAAGLVACLQGRGPRTCPEPDERYLPGSLRGSLRSSPDALSVGVGASADGVLEVTGDVSVVGTWRRLDFDNQVHAGKGTVQVQVVARGYATDPLRFAWGRPGSDS